MAVKDSGSLILEAIDKFFEYVDSGLPVRGYRSFRFLSEGVWGENDPTHDEHDKNWHGKNDHSADYRRGYKTGWAFSAHGRGTGVAGDHQSDAYKEGFEHGKNIGGHAKTVSNWMDNKTEEGREAAENAAAEVLGHHSHYLHRKIGGLARAKAHEHGAGDDVSAFTGAEGTDDPSQVGVGHYAANLYATHQSAKGRGEDAQPHSMGMLHIQQLHKATHPDNPSHDLEKDESVPQYLHKRMMGFVTGAKEGKGKSGWLRALKGEEPKELVGLQPSGLEGEGDDQSGGGYGQAHQDKSALTPAEEVAKSKLDTEKFVRRALDRVASDNPFMMKPPKSDMPGMSPEDVMKHHHEASKEDPDRDMSKTLKELSDSGKSALLSPYLVMSYHIDMSKKTMGGEERELSDSKRELSTMGHVYDDKATSRAQTVLRTGEGGIETDPESGKYGTILRKKEAEGVEKARKERTKEKWGKKPKEELKAASARKRAYDDFYKTRGRYPTDDEMGHFDKHGEFPSGVGESLEEVFSLMRLIEQEYGYSTNLFNKELVMLRNILS